MASLTSTRAQRRLVLEPGFDARLADAQWIGPCEVCAANRTTVEVNTVDFDVLDEDTFSAAIARFVACGNSHVVNFLAAHPTVVARQVPRYREILHNADLLVADGTPIALTMRLTNPRARRVTGADGFLRVCSDGVPRGLRHYFVGGANEEVAHNLRRNLEAMFPEISIVGFKVPPFRPYEPDELDELIASMKDAEADVVWVGLGAPKQEVLAHRLRIGGGAPAILTIGAIFDFASGTKARAPKLLRTLGLEWLFRFVQEPRRLWRRYLLGNAQFVMGVLKDKFAGGSSKNNEGRL